MVTTLIAPMSPEELTIAFDSLKQSAKSIHDVQNWLSENPSVLFSQLPLPVGAVIEVELTAMDDDLLSDGVSHEAIELFLGFTLLYERQDAFPIRRMHSTRNASKQNALRQQSFLHMPFAEWPLACALVAEVYIKRRGFETGLILMDNLPFILDKHIKTHFPGWTMQKLVDLAELDLLQKSVEGELASESVCKLLFGSRKTTNCVHVPTDYGVAQ